MSEVVKRSTAPRPYTGNGPRWAAEYIKMNELAPDECLKIDVPGVAGGRAASKALGIIARKEGRILRVSRNTLGTEFYFWLE